MKRIAMFVALVAILSGQTPSSALPHVRHLVYQFGYNTKVASQGTGTGTTTIDISGPAADGGMLISGADYWWNTARPRATNTCEVYAGGAVSCSQRPYALSVIQLTLFPLLAKAYFQGLSADGKSTWTHNYAVKAAIIPGANGFAGELYTWNCTYTLHGNGAIAGAAPLVLVVANGKLVQQGGRYLSATDKQRIAYDPTLHVPVIVSDVRTHFPQTTVYNNDLIEVKLLKDSLGKHPPAPSEVP